jgi:hypothetical protein
MAVFLVVVGCATMTFYNCWDRTKTLRRNADDIARALDVGERWRADIREAKGPIQLTTGQFQAGEVIYTFANGEIRRRSEANGPDTLWLSNVKSSQIQPDARARTGWRWELELKPTRREARLRPLFTFESVAGTAPVQ